MYILVHAANTNAFPYLKNGFRILNMIGACSGESAICMGKKMKDCVLDVENIRKDIQAFLQS